MTAFDMKVVTKPRKLRLVAPQERPLAALSMAEKRANAIHFLRERNLYVLDKGARKPTWGVPSAHKANK